MESKVIYKTDQIIAPENPMGANIKWVFGQDEISSKIKLKLGINLPADLLTQISHLYERDRLVLNEQNILGIEGRKVIFSIKSGININGIEYDALEAGGYGYQPFLDSSTVAAGMVDPYAAVQLPSNSNFSDLMPSLNRTNVVDEKGKFKTIKDKFTFTGGYTLDEATRKVAGNLTILSRLIGEEKLPFIVPIPIAIGTYNNLRDPSGFPACFVSWLVPYQGERTGRADVTPDKVGELVKKMIKNNPRISEALRFLHDKLGLTHNQAVATNFYVPDNEDLPSLLADFGTLYPLSPGAKNKARAHDLSHIIDSIISYSDQAVGHSNILEMLPQIVNRFLYYYLKPDNSKVQVVERRGEKGKKLLLETIIESLNQAEQLGIFPINIPIYSTWNQINLLSKSLRRTVLTG